MFGKKIFLASIGFASLIFVWQLIVVLGKYETALLPPPIKVGEAIAKLFTEGTIWEHVQISLYRFIVGYLIAAITGILIGLFLGRMKILWSVIDPVVQVLRPISPIAWSPFIVLWFGIGNTPAMVIIFIAAFFPILLSTVAAVRKVDSVYLRVAENFELTRFQLLTKVVFPAAFPMIANGLHMAIGSAWIFLVAGEMVGAQSGLGYLIVDSRNSLSLDVVLASITIIGLLGLIIDRLIHYFENWVTKIWGGNVKA